MKIYLLLITLLCWTFVPRQVLADDHYWHKKTKDFLSSVFPSVHKYCVNYEGNIYTVGEIFKSKNCKKGDRELILSPSVQTGPQGPQGEIGPKGDQGSQGVQGEKGDKGDLGSSGISGWEKISTTSASTTDQLKTVIVNCPENKKVLSGGFSVNSSAVTYYTVSNFPSSDTSWSVSIHRSSTTTPWNLDVYAICVIAN